MTVILKSPAKGQPAGTEYTGPDEEFLLINGYAGPVDAEEAIDTVNPGRVDYDHDRDNPLNGDPIATVDASLPAVDPGILLGSDRQGETPEPEPVGPANPTGNGELLPTIDPATRLGAEGNYVTEQVEDIDADYLAHQDEVVAHENVSEQETELAEGLEPHVANEPVKNDDADADVAQEEKGAYGDFVNAESQPFEPVVEEPAAQVQPTDFAQVDEDTEVPASDFDSFVDTPAEVAEDVESGDATVGGPDSTVSQNPSV